MYSARASSSQSSMLRTVEGERADGNARELRVNQIELGADAQINEPSLIYFYPSARFVKQELASSYKEGGGAVSVGLGKQRIARVGQQILRPGEGLAEVETNRLHTWDTRS